MGQKLPNGFDLFDMHGNVREWCADWFSEDYYNVLPVDDPEGPSGGDGSRTLRGGGSNTPPGLVRSADRNRNKPTTYQSGGVGFRPILLIDPTTDPKPTP